MATQDMTVAAQETLNNLVARISASEFYRVSSVRAASQCGGGIAAMVFVDSVSKLDSTRVYDGMVTVYANGSIDGYGRKFA